MNSHKKAQNTQRIIFCAFCAFLWLIFSGESHTRFACLKTVSTQNRASDFRLKRNLVVLAAVVADDFKARRRVLARRRFFRAAFRASLRRHHISLIKNSLLFFRKNKNVFTLHARHFNIRHHFLLFQSKSLWRKCIINQINS